MIRISEQQAAELIAFIMIRKDEVLQGSIVEEALDVMRDQLNHPRHIGDLVDTIAGLISTPRAKIALNGNLLNAIRGAILSPRELERAKAIEATAQGCTNCGIQLANGEAVNITHQQIYCVMCAPPVTLTCKKCKGILALPASIMKIITKTVKECKCCADRVNENAATGANPGARIDEDQPIGHLDRLPRTAVFPPDMTPPAGTVVGRVGDFIVDVAPVAPLAGTTNHNLAWPAPQEALRHFADNVNRRRREDVDRRLEEELFRQINMPPAMDEPGEEE